MATGKEERLWDTDPDAAYAEAERRIAEVKRNGGDELSLSFLRALQKVPPSIAELTGLRALSLWNTSVTDIAVLGQLANLQYLGLQGTSVTDIAVLGQLANLQTLGLNGTSVTDIAVLGQLANLQHLGLSSTSVTDIAALGQLANLQRLDLQHTSVTDIAVLGQLANLQHLYLANTSFTDIAALGRLANLQTLDLDGTSVTDIAALGQLANLQDLNLNDTSVTDIAALGRLANLQTLDLDGTSVTDIAALGRLENLKDCFLNNTPVADLRPLLSHRKLMEDPGRYGLQIKITKAIEVIPELADAAEIDDAKDRAARIFEILEGLPPWPLPLNAEEALGKVEARSLLGLQASIRGSGTIGFEDPPIDGLSDVAKRLWARLREDYEDFVSICKNAARTEFGGNVYPNLLMELEPFGKQVFAAQTDALDLWMAAADMRAQAQAEQQRVDDEFKEAYYVPEVGTALRKLQATYNLFSANAPVLAALDRNALDPALRPASDVGDPAKDIFGAMEGAEGVYEPSSLNKLRVLLSRSDAAQPASVTERNFQVAIYSQFNLLMKTASVAWFAIPQSVKDANGQAWSAIPQPVKDVTKRAWSAIPPIGKDATLLTAAGSAFWATGMVGQTFGLPVLGGLFIYRNRQTILKFLERIPESGALRDVVDLISHGMEKLMKEAKKKDDTSDGDNDD